MSKYEKSEKRFNFIDVLIVFAVLFIVCALFFRAQIIDFFGDSERRTECVIEFQGEAIPEESIEYIKKGINLKWLECEQELGVLGDFEVTPSIMYIQKNDGTYDKVGNPSAYDISGKITAKVLYDSEKGCFVGGTSFLAPGMVITVYSENVQFKLTVIGIEY